MTSEPDIDHALAAFQRLYDSSGRLLNAFQAHLREGTMGSAMRLGWEMRTLHERLCNPADAPPKPKYEAH